MSHASAGGFAMPCAESEPRVARIGARALGPQVIAGFAGRTVRIWSDEWGAWWRPGGAGYTNREALAGEWRFEDALREVSHCGPEKRIFLDILA